MSEKFVNFKIYQREKMFSKTPYRKIWEDKIDCDGYHFEEEALEEIFKIFNINHPEEYKGRSLSVGDVVELKGILFLCDSVGWSKISPIDFLLENANSVSVAGEGSDL